MKATKRTAEKLAEEFGCSLDATDTGKAGGWLITLDAPDGMVFKGLDTSCDCNIYGNGVSNSDIDWDRVIESIRHAVASGFEDAE